MLVLIKTIHSVIWLVFVACIGFILWSGVTDNISWFTWLAVVAIILEGGVLLINKGYCPLTTVARKYSDSPKPNFDIYLPEWVAKYNKQLFGTLFILGIIVLLVRILS